MKFSKVFIVVFIVAFAICPAFAFDKNNRNLFLIGIMSLSPFLILLLKKSFFKTDLLLIIFMGIIYIFPTIVHPSTMRTSTVFYSWMFCLSFIAFSKSLYNSSFSALSYQTVIRNLIFAFIITLIVQQFCVLTKLPIFNIRFYNLNEPWKLNSLGAEPSWAGRIIGLLMYSYISIKEINLSSNYSMKQNFKEDKWLWIGFFWAMITMGSSTSILFLFIVLLKFINKKNILQLSIMIVLLVSLVIFFDVNSFNRTYNIFKATLTFDPAKIIAADHSASFRIVPIILLSTKVNLNTIDGWFGHGVDSITVFMSDYLKADGVSGGGMLQVWMEFGFLAFILFTYFSFKATVNKRDYNSFIFWFFLVFIYGINNQIVWLCIILLYTNKYFLNKSEYGSKKKLYRHS